MKTNADKLVTNKEMREEFKLYQREMWYNRS